MNFRIASSPHNRLQRKTSDVMLAVALACIPGILAQVWYFGIGVLVQIMLAMAAALIAELICLRQRNRSLKQLKDNTALLTGLLLGICLPPLAPWWIAIIGASFAIIIAKQIYGGLGQNIFNPAMAGYVVLLVSFPLSMTLWLPPLELIQYDLTTWDMLMVIFTGYSEQGYSLAQFRTNLDGFTMATPLDAIKTGLSNQQTYQEIISQNIFSDSYGLGWMQVNLAYLLGGLWLLQRKIINWHIPTTFILVLFGLSFFYFLAAPESIATPTIQLTSGATMFAAFFILTDPVSASTTAKGRIVYAALIALLVFLIRNWGGYPEAVAFAVLLANMCVPLIDYYTKPRTYGHVSR
ncbi:electron transport complex subunit RsxD [Catenovulum adriaticum]|uniref:Ion-translocating oxidoreductase complex subunit D n=1 Tax=Catenovulum adriaticum TaxID=2984846 RepID=A0ABY7ALF4_9ALTE|nr:electron transport complex subunit RsxD [Catenovulum sp. TS8]WAJ69496.1 electron transport complex subunit RsxD [Catenovulum sp. TS8]